MTKDGPIDSLKGVGQELAKKFLILGIKSIEELIDNFPRRYEDYSLIIPIKKIKPGICSIEATISQLRGRYVRRGMHITEAIATDQSGSVRLVWFNQPYRQTALKPNQKYYISGQYELSHQRFAIMSPSTELVSSFPVNTARIVPIYRETKGLSSTQIRRALREASPLIHTAPETLPDWMIKANSLMPRSEAVFAMHFPKDAKNLEAAKRRLGFEEVLQLSLAAMLNKKELNQDQALGIPFQQNLARQFVTNLPFKLTDSQRKVVWRIYQDMQNTQPMNRLIEGDVGSGKTVVAAMAALMAMHAGFQTAIMAPTELLALQHSENIYRLLEPLGLHSKVVALVGGMKKKEKDNAKKSIKNGRAQLIIGTHALIQEKIDMHKLGLVVVDEQHRFGVEQRKKLMAKAGHMPHLLSLTATPIPRSLALTLYGELDISILDQKPAGRLPIITSIASPNSRAQLYAEIDKQLEAGRQMFVVCPLILESTNKNTSHSAEAVYQHLGKKEFKHRRIGLLHGKMKPADKNKVMHDFVRHELDILVSTTVIEVGVDVPNATVMLIEAAERFGLAQIHQLRGRVGRSEHQGYCYLMSSESTPSPRLRALERLNDGFRLAELDLDIRGPGAIYGTLQHGALDLRVAKLTDTKLIASSRQAAADFISRNEDLLQYTYLNDRVTTLRAVTNLN